MQPDTLIRHAITFYAELENQATLENNVLVFRGSFSDVYNKTGIPNAHYSQVRRFLVESECLEVVQRGNRSTESVVALLKSPSVETAEDFTIEPLTTRADLDTLREEVERLKAWRETFLGLDVTKVLQNFEMRLSKIEDEILNAKQTT